MTVDVDATGDIRELGAQPREGWEWGLELTCTRDEARVHVWHWPSEGPKWLHRLDVREFDYNTPSHLDPSRHLLKATAGMDDVFELASRDDAAPEELQAAVKHAFDPLWEQVTAWVPPSKHNGTDVRIIAAKGMRQLPEVQQCALWREVRNTLRGSVFTHGEIELISLAPAAPYRPRRCNGLLVR